MQIRAATIGIAALAIACGGEREGSGGGAASPSTTATATTTPSPSTATAGAPSGTASSSETTPGAPAPPAAVLAPQRAHRAAFARHRGEGFSLAVGWRIVAIHDEADRVRATYPQVGNGYEYVVRFWPAPRPDVVLGAWIVGDNEGSSAARVYAVHVREGRFVELPREGNFADPVLVALGPDRVVVGHTVYGLDGRRVRELDLAPDDRERAERDAMLAEAEEDGRSTPWSEGAIEREDAALARSDDGARLAHVAVDGRAAIFDARSLARIAVAPALDVDHDELASGGYVRRALFLPGTTRLVVVTRDGAHEVSEAGARTPVDRATLPPDEDAWRSTSADSGEGDEGFEEPAGGRAGERAIWHVGFVPGRHVAITSGRGAVLRWDARGARSLACLQGESPIDFDGRGRLREPGGYCDPETGEGRAGPRRYADQGPIDDPWMGCPPSLAARDAARDVEWSSDAGDAASGGTWEGFEVSILCQDPRPLTNAGGADPSGLVWSDDREIFAMPVANGTRFWESRTGAPLVTLVGGGRLLGESADRTRLFVRRDRDGHAAVIARRGARVLFDAGVAPDAACEPTPILERGDVIAAHDVAGVRILDAATLAVRATIDAPGACGMRLAGDRVFVRSGERYLVRSLDGAAVGDLAAPAGFLPSDDGSAMWRCADGVLEVRDAASGEARGRWRGDCQRATLSSDARFAIVRDAERTRARIVRVRDGAELVVGAVIEEDDEGGEGGEAHPFAVASDGAFWTEDGEAHDLFAIRLGPRILDDPLVHGEEAWTRLRRASLLADFFEDRPLPTGR